MDGWINMSEAGGLQQAFDALPEQGGTVYVPTGTWDISETVEVQLAEGQHLFLVGDGRASVLTNTQTSGEPLLTIEGVVGKMWPDLRITVRDIAFVGSHDSGDALVVNWPYDTMVDACHFEGHGGKAVYLQRHSSNVTVRDCWMRDCRHAVYVEGCHHLTIHGCQTRSMSNDITPWLRERVGDADGSVSLPQRGQEQAAQVYVDDGCFEVRIVNNHLAYGHAEGVLMEGTANHVIANNTIEGFARQIAVVNSRDMVITGNYLREGIGVELAGECNGIAITSNFIGHSMAQAIVLRDASDSGGHVISGNVIRLGQYDAQGGIALGDARACVVANNVLEDVNEGAAISAGPGGGGHAITGNNVTGATRALDLSCETQCELASNLIDETHERSEDLDHVRQYMDRRLGDRRSPAGS